LNSPQKRFFNILFGRTPRLLFPFLDGRRGLTPHILPYFLIHLF
jgi:hypothetical protein